MLVTFTLYVPDAIIPAFANPSWTLAPPPTHLIDVHCVAGLFALIVAPHITKVTRIELCADLIHFSTHSSEIKDLHTLKVAF